MADPLFGHLFFRKINFRQSILFIASYIDVTPSKY
jgi:hypothetical protein